MSYVFCQQCGHRNLHPVDDCSACGRELSDVPDRTVVLAKIDPLMDAPGLQDNVIVNLDDIPVETPILVVRGGDREGDFFFVGKNEFSIGRLDSCDLVLDDITVSRKHCVIASDRGRFRVLDAGSLNGTYVNGLRVEEGDLAQGDELQVGRFHLMFFQNEGAAS